MRSRHPKRWGGLPRQRRVTRDEGGSLGADVRPGHSGCRPVLCSSALAPSEPGSGRAERVIPVTISESNASLSVRTCRNPRRKCQDPGQDLAHGSVRGATLDLPSGLELSVSVRYRVSCGMLERAGRCHVRAASGHTVLRDALEPAAQRWHGPSCMLGNAQIRRVAARFHRHAARSSSDFRSSPKLAVGSATHEPLL